MLAMVVTLDVFQPEMSALNVSTHGASLMSLDMSVTADTSQDPIVPCSTSAAAALVQYASRAAARSVLVANAAADAAWAIASKPSRRQRPLGKAAWPVERDAAPGLVERANRACDGSRGLRVPVASVCPAAAVGIGDRMGTEQTGIRKRGEMGDSARSTLQTTRVHQKTRRGQ